MMKLPPAGPSELSPRGSSGSAGKVEGNFEISVRHTDLVTHRTQSRHSDHIELEPFCHDLVFPPRRLIWDSLIDIMLQVEALRRRGWDGWSGQLDISRSNGTAKRAGWEFEIHCSSNGHFSKISRNSSTLAGPWRTRHSSHDVISAVLPENATLQVFEDHFCQKMGFGPIRW